MGYIKVKINVFELLFFEKYISPNNVLINFNVINILKTIETMTKEEDYHGNARYEKIFNLLVLK